MTTSLTSHLTLSEKSAYLVRALREIKRRQARNRLTSYNPSAKQIEFHRNGRLFNERLFMAGNQLGKTMAGGAEFAYHLTGEYPEWWDGLRFDEPPLLWAGGVTGETTRDNPQKILLGEPARDQDWGTGMIPGNKVLDTTRARGVPDLLDNIQVKHVNGTSQVSFKAYEKGREKWQGPSVNLVWFDEEPPAEIYSEGKTRTHARGIHTMITFTPLLGLSEVVMMFLSDEEAAAMKTA